MVKRFHCALLAAAFLAGSAVAQDEPAATDKDVHIYWPIAYFPGLGDRLIPSAERVKAMLDRSDVSFSLSMVPIRRSFHLYKSDPRGCVIYSQKRLDETEILSDVAYYNNHWLYVRASSGITDISQIQSAGTLDGAERYVPLSQLYGQIQWQFAPTYQALIGMLESGRVEAVTLGPLVEAWVVSVPDGLVKLGEEAKPFVQIAAHLHCKPTEKAARMIEHLNARLAAEQEILQER